jgi:hypothetical protein
MIRLFVHTDVLTQEKYDLLVSHVPTVHYVYTQGIWVIQVSELSETRMRLYPSTFAYNSLMTAHDLNVLVLLLNTSITGYQLRNKLLQLNVRIP